MLADILDKIIKQTKIDLEQRKSVMSMDMLGMSLSYNPYVPRDVKPFFKNR